MPQHPDRSPASDAPASRTPSAATDADRAAIESVVDTFFAAFTSGPDLHERIDDLRRSFLPEAVIVTTSGGSPAVHDVEGFLAPREALLARGDLVDFREWQTEGRTDLFGDIAQHFCSYAKSWNQDGSPHSGRGRKSMQLVRTGGVWRLVAVVWDDEREGATWDGPQPV